MSTRVSHQEERRAYAEFALVHAEPDCRQRLAALYAAWRGFNREFFRGGLLDPHLTLGRTASRSLGHCTRLTEKALGRGPRRCRTAARGGGGAQPGLAGFPCVPAGRRAVGRPGAADRASGLGAGLDELRPPVRSGREVGQNIGQGPVRPTWVDVGQAVGLRSCNLLV